MFLLDTNVLLYAADRNAEAHSACHRLLESARDGATPWYTTWPVIYEFLRVSTHPNVFRSPWSIGNAWRFIEGLFSSVSFGVLIATERHREVAAELFSITPALRGNVLHDAHTAILMREHGIRRIYTRDGDFRLFPFLEVLDPLKS